jgi:hypothetical protein
MQNNRSLTDTGNALSVRRPGRSYLGLMGGLAIGLGCLGGAGSARADILAQFQGSNVVDAGFFWPPDMGGAVGPAGVVQFVNGAFADYNSNGTLQAPRITDSTFWLDAGISSSIVAPGVADPRIIYDPGSGRFFASGIGVGNGTNANQVLLAVSNDSNPLHGFKAINFASSPGGLPEE